jgi:hypothetical protein
MSLSTLVKDRTRIVQIDDEDYLDIDDLLECPFKDCEKDFKSQENLRHHIQRIHNKSRELNIKRKNQSPTKKQPKKSE